MAEMAAPLDPPDGRNPRLDVHAGLPPQGKPQCLHLHFVPQEERCKGPLRPRPEAGIAGHALVSKRGQYLSLNFPTLDRLSNPPLASYMISGKAWED
jgi:hypothetical protein